MKREKTLSCLSAGVLAFCLGFGSVACMVTGLKLPVEWFWLCFGCALGAVVAVGCLCFKWGGVILGGLAGVYGLLMLTNDRALEQCKALCYSAFTYYNHGYGIPIPDWMEGQTADTQLLPLLFIAGLVITAVAWTVLRRKRAWLAVTAALLPLATCLVVTDTVPEIFAVFILLLGLVVLMMTQSVRRWDEKQGNRLTGLLALPVAAALMLLILAVPRGDYNAPAQTGSVMSVFDWFASKLPFVGQTSEGELVFSLGGDISDEVDLSALGKNIQRDTPVMEVTADFSGQLYLRGRDYDSYDGLGWSATEERNEEDFGPPESWSGNTRSITVRSMGRRGQLYIPYYPAGQQTLQGGAVDNKERLTEYSYEFSGMRDNWENLWRSYQLDFYSGVISEEASADRRYLELPDETRQRAEEILGTLEWGEGDDALVVAQIIGEYVKNSAEYDLNTDRMPDSQTDFVMWFLEESGTGYCVHFASAATVLLRAAGIPARYVEGYMTDVRSGRTTIIRERQAHAWVEYYLDHVGWVVLDATPGFGGEPEETVDPWEEIFGSSESTQPTQPTQPETTAPATEESTAPQQSTTGTTQAAQSTGSTGSGGSGEKTLPGWFVSTLWTLIWIVALGLAVVGQWILRRYFKLRRMYQGKVNVQALARFREAKLVARLWRIPLPDALQALAEKARFSQYTLTKEELARFDAFLREGVRELRNRPWYYRFVCRFIFAAY